MAQYSAELDGVLSPSPIHAARRHPAPRAARRRGELARDFPMTLPSFMKHVRTLETNGLISTVKSGRVRT